MAWTTPRTWSVAEKVTAALVNAHVKANLDFLSTPPSCRVTASSVATVADATLVLVAFDAETFDTATMHDNSTNNSRLVAPVAGKYLVICQVEWTANATGFRAVHARKNAAGSNSGGTAMSQSNVTASASALSATLADVYDLAANDYIEIFRYQNSGGVLAPAPVIGGGIPAHASMTWVGF